MATRVNKGTKYARKLLDRYLIEMKNKYSKFYILKFDIKKYFFNINHEVLINKLRKYLNGDEIKIIRNIISETNYSYINDSISIINLNNNMAFPLYKFGSGLSIGNVCSQMLAVFYLNDFDHYIKEVLGCKYYIRYMDDLILFSDDYHYLVECLERIKVVINEHKLCLNEKTRIFSLKDGISFLGYRFVVKNNKVITLPSDKNFKVIRKRSRKQKDIEKNYNGYLKALSVNVNHLICQ